MVAHITYMHYNFTHTYARGRLSYAVSAIEGDLLQPVKAKYVILNLVGFYRMHVIAPSILMPPAL